MGSKRLKVVILVVGIIVGMTSFGLYRMYWDNNRNQKIGGLQMGVIDSNGDEEFEKRIQESLNAQVEAGMVSLFVNTNIHLENGDSQAKLLIQNGENNTFAQQIQVVDIETNEIYYDSPVIKPGYKIESDYLKVKLSKGTYKCRAIINILDVESGNKVNTTGLDNIQIVVEN